MTELNPYLSLFEDSFISTFALSIRSELIIYVMKIWGDYSNLYIFLVATLGASLSLFLDYLIGTVLYKIFLTYGDENMVVRYAKIQSIFHKYGNTILSLSFVPYAGKFIPLIAGFTRYGRARSLVLSVISKACYYFFLIY